MDSTSISPEAGNQPREPEAEPPLTSTGGNSRCKTMLNEVVLGRIAEMLTAKESLSVRETCTAWNRIFIRAVKENHKPISLHSFMHDKSLVAYAEVMKPSVDSMEVPFTKYVLNNCTIRPQDLDEFVSVCGSTIKTLTIMSMSEHGTTCNFGAIRRAIQQLPNLHELRLTVQSPAVAAVEEDMLLTGPLLQLKKFAFSCGYKPDLDICRDFLRDIIKCSVNLEYLSLTHMLHNDPAISELSESANLHKLKTLKAHMVSDSELTILTNLASRKQNSLRLSAFTTSIGCISPDFWEAMYKFLVSQALTLEKLKIRVLGCETIVIEVPKMLKMKSFRFRKSSKLQRVLYDEETLRQNFPALKRLVVQDTVFSNDLEQNWIEYFSTIAHDKVLELSLRGCVASLRCVEAMRYDSINTLEITLNRPDVKEFHQLWTKWPTLQNLTITCQHYLPKNTMTMSYHMACNITLGVCKNVQNPPFINVDELLTGVPKESLQSLSSEPTLRPGDLTLDKLFALQKKYKKNPGISDLKLMRKFKLQINPKLTERCECEYENLTDIGGYLGLAMASPHLQHVSINGGAAAAGATNQGSQLSPECLEMIMTALGSTSVLYV